MSIYDIAGILGQSYPRAFMPENIASGFRAAGIYPFDKEIFKDGDFMASYVTDRRNPDNEDLDDAVAAGTCSSAANDDQGSADPATFATPTSAIRRASGLVADDRATSHIPTLNLSIGPLLTPMAELDLPFLPQIYPQLLLT